MTQTPKSGPSMGFWRCWAMTVGLMIGSGIFGLPAVLAPLGGLGFLGWLVTSAGAILIALVLGRLAARTERTGGLYAFAHDAFGDLTGFIVAWGYWLGVVFATTAIAVVFAGYAGTLVPALGANSLTQALTAAALIWTLTAINLRGVSEAATFQLIATLLKLVPLLVIIGLGIAAGSADNLPPFNPRGEPPLQGIAAAALLTMWAFLGLEGGVVAVSDTIDPTRTMPRAVVAGTLTVTVVYIASTAAVMMLVPMDRLAGSQAPFADAATALGSWGAPFIAVGVLISTTGALNANILVSGQIPMAVALDGLAPRVFARRNRGHSPAGAILFSSILSTALLVLNYTEGLVAAFEFLITMATLATLVPYAVSALAELSYSWKRARAWTVIALVAIVYTLVAIAGSGREAFVWGVVLFVLAVPVFYLTAWANKRA